MEIYFKKCFKCVLIEYKYLFKNKKQKKNYKISI